MIILRSAIMTMTPTKKKKTLLHLLLHYIFFYARATESSEIYRRRLALENFFCHFLFLLFFINYFVHNLESI